jgi:uncharacterized protein (DUF433 family)
MIISSKNTRAIIKDYKAGMLTKDILAKYNISRSTLYYILDKSNIKKNCQKVISDSVLEELIYDYKRGCTYRYLMKKYNLRRERIEQTFKEHNVTRPIKRGHINHDNFRQRRV